MGRQSPRRLFGRLLNVFRLVRQTHSTFRIEAMPELSVGFLAVDELQLASPPRAPQPPEWTCGWWPGARTMQTRLHCVHGREHCFSYNEPLRDGIASREPSPRRIVASPHRGQ
jgi:hypothetical protein